MCVEMLLDKFLLLLNVNNISKMVSYLLVNNENAKNNQENRKMV